MHKIGFGFPRRINVLNRIKTGWTIRNTPLTLLLALLILINLVGCGNNPPEVPQTSPPPITTSKPVKRISEVSPPSLIQKLHQSLDAYQPEVTILTPQPDQVIEDDTLTVKLQVNGLPLFKDPQFGLGPHLQVILDNQPDVAVYDPTQSVTFSNLQPGTHTLRVLAAYPWDETYKNAGAFAETTFHVFTKIAQNNPNSELPLLTYNRPQGTYGAEPILLDFYLANAPLHIVAQDNPTDEIIDWQIRATVNGESFMIDRWQPIYIKGLQPGKNWVQLEYLDEQGNPVNNVYNSTARVITYDPTLNDTFSQLIKGELPFAQVKGIADPNVLIQELIETSELEQPIIVEPEVPTLEEEVTSVPSSEPETLTELEPAEVEPIPVVEPTVEPEVIETETDATVTEPQVTEIETDATIVEPEPSVIETDATVVTEPQVTEIETDANVVESEPSIIETIPVIEPTPDPEPPSVEPESLTEEKPVPVSSVFEASNVQADVSSSSQPTKINQFFNRFRLPFFNSVAAETQPVETLPEIVEEVPIPEPPSNLEPGQSPNLLPNVDSLENTIRDRSELETNASETLEEEVQPETTIQVAEPETTPTEPPVPPVEAPKSLTIPQLTTEI